MERFVKGICLLVQLAGITGITCIALKRNKECYEAEMKCIDAEFERNCLEFDNELKRMEINALKAELAEFKNKTEES